MRKIGYYWVQVALCMRWEIMEYVTDGSQYFFLSFVNPGKRFYEKDLTKIDERRIIRES